MKVYVGLCTQLHVIHFAQNIHMLALIKNSTHGTLAHDILAHDTLAHDTLAHDTLTHDTFAHIQYIAALLENNH